MKTTSDEMTSRPVARRKEPIPRGPIVIGLFFLFGVAMSLFAIYYQARNMQRALAFWGPNEDAPLIRNGSKVELWDVKRADAESDSKAGGIDNGNHFDGVAFTLDGSEWKRSNRRDVSQAKGLVHLRDALLDDFQYDWDTTIPPDVKLSPEHALLFYSGDDNTPGKGSISTVLIDSKSNIICSLRTNRRASSKKIVDAYRKVVEQRSDPNRN